jgi:hypothetical protein
MLVEYLCVIAIFILGVCVTYIITSCSSEQYGGVSRSNGSRPSGSEYGRPSGQYRKMKDVGYHPLDYSEWNIKSDCKSEDEPRDLEHKYDGNRYAHRRRYNFLSRQNSAMRS